MPRFRSRSAGRPTEDQHIYLYIYVYLYAYIHVCIYTYICPYIQYDYLCIYVIQLYVYSFFLLSCTYSSALFRWIHRARCRNAAGMAAGLFRSAGSAGSRKGSARLWSALFRSGAAVGRRSLVAFAARSAASCPRALLPGRKLSRPMMTTEAMAATRENHFERAKIILKAAQRRKNNLKSTPQK